MATETQTGYRSHEAAAYAASRHGSDGRAFLDPHISAFLQDASGNILLDVGGGAAKVAVEAVRSGSPFVYVLDNSPAMLEQAERTIWEEGLPDQIATVRGDARTLPYPENYFPRLTSVNVGCNLDTDTLAAHFSEMSRVVTPDGQILFTAPINLGIVFANHEYFWETNLENKLIALNDALSTSEDVQATIQQHLGRFDQVHRASFIIRDNQLRLVVEEPERLPEGLRALTVPSSEVQDGEEIWRKIPGLVVRNNWHTQATYERLMEEAGLEVVAMHSDSFATAAEMFEYNMNVADYQPGQTLGREYIGQSPFAVYVLRKITPERRLEIRSQRIAQTYHAFRQEHDFDTTPLHYRNPEQLQGLSDELQQRMAQALGVENFTPRPMNREAMQAVGEAMKNGGVMLMRHGPQNSKDPSKIEQMKPPQNMTDPATAEGLAEFAGTLLGIEYTIGKMLKAHPYPEENVKLRIITSLNQRALDVANVIGKVFSTRVAIEPRLKCMDYLPEVNDTNSHLKNGAVSWNREDIDAVFGEGSYTRKSNEDLALLTETRQVTTDPTLTIIIGHTQDTNVADFLAGREPKRLDNFGFIYFPRRHPDHFTSVQMPHGVYHAA